MDSKICAKCKIVKPLDEFHKDPHTSTQRASRCKKCRSKGKGRPPVDQRFWKYVRRGGEQDCWEWQGGTLGRFGYGAFHAYGKIMSAHRFSWELHNGKITDGLWVLHRCDNPKCVNPQHLFLGTAQDNASDMVSKGRHFYQRHPAYHQIRMKIIHRGEYASHVKLTSAKVIEMRTLKANGYSLSQLAERYGVDQSAVSLIVNRKRWTHI